MGPKKGKKEKKGGKGSKKSAAGASDENDPSKENEAERLELVKAAKTLLEMTKKEEQAFNEFQQQREKINYFWIVEKKNFEDRKAELRNKERERQDLEEKHQVEIKVCFAFVSLDSHVKCVYRDQSHTHILVVFYCIRRSTSSESSTCCTSIRTRSRSSRRTWRSL